MARSCVYTVIYGSTDRLHHQPVRAESSLDFIAFTDDPTAAWPGWTCRYLPQRVPGDPVRSSRYVKFHPHVLLPNYDASLYLDATVLLRQPPEVLFSTLLDGHTDTMACLAHSHRDCVLDEVRAVLSFGYDDPELCLRQMAAYARAGWSGAVQLTWSGLLLRHHHHPDVVAAMQMWWEQVLRFSRRDQLSFAFVAEHQGFPFIAHALDNEASPFHQWPVPRERVRAPWNPALPAFTASNDGASDFQSRLVALLGELDASITRQARVDIMQARAEADAWRETSDALRASRSWRVTAPLRRAATWLRGG
jgi:hypothetical protein